MMALHVGLRRAVPPAAIVGYSGLLIMPGDAMTEAFAAEIKSRPPVLLIHGDEDQLIPVQAVAHSAQGLAAVGIPAEWHISPGIGHGIDQEGLRHGGEFLAKQFARETRSCTCLRVTPHIYFTIPSRCPITRRFAAWRQPLRRLGASL